MFTEQEHAEARRNLVVALAILASPAAMTPSLASRNIMFHAEEMLRWMDAFYSGKDPDNERDGTEIDS